MLDCTEHVTAGSTGLRRHSFPRLMKEEIVGEASPMSELLSPARLMTTVGCAISSAKDIPMSDRGQDEAAYCAQRKYRLIEQCEEKGINQTNPG